MPNHANILLFYLTLCQGDNYQINAAAKGSGKTAMRARLAQTFAKMRKG